MKPIRFVLTLLVLTCTCCLSGRAQGGAAVPFLLFPPSSEANGMAGITIALPRFDPTASVFSPAQVGISALTTNVRVGFYSTGSGLPIGYTVQGMSYTAWAASVGVRLNDFVDLPFRIGIGLAYHRVDEDLGTFTITGSGGPTPIGMFEASENGSGIVFGVALEYLLRFGFGYTFRSVKSHLSPIGTEQEVGNGDADGNSNDYSFLMDAPLVSIVEKIAGDRLLSSEKVQPFLDLAGGLGWNNMGDKLVYIDPAQADPFPRTARTGIALRGGVRITRDTDWEIISAAWSREADDLLVTRKQDGTWEYQSGLGDIQFGENVIQGRSTDGVTLRSGWQVQVGEIFTYRNGSVKAYNAYDTRGYTIQLAGFLKGMTEIFGMGAPPWLTFARDHVDMQYHSADYKAQPQGTNLTSYSGVTILMHEWPW